MRILSKILILLSIALNIIHLILPFSGFSLNDSFSPQASFFGILTVTVIFYLYSSIKKDWLFLLILYSSYICQNISFQLNNGVPDYINLYVFKSNIPDFLMFTSVLTWWYFRVYKSKITLPAEVRK